MPTPFFADLVRELCQEGGTGPLTPTGAVPGHRRFAGTVPADTPFHYAVAGIARPEQWEVGLGRLDEQGRLVRDGVASSSNGGTPVDFAPGLKTIALTVGAGWFTAKGAALSDLDAAVSALAASLNGPVSLADGSAGAPSITFGSDLDTGLYRTAANVLGIATGGAPRVAISNSGFGFGTTSPAYTGDFRGANLSIESAVDYNGYVRIANSLRAWIVGMLGAPGWERLSFYDSTASEERMSIYPGGRVGIGTGGTAPSSAFGFDRQLQITGPAPALTLDGITGAKKYSLGVSGSGNWLLRDETAGASRLILFPAGAFAPGADNAQAWGDASLRWSVIYAGTGTINTSDGREKTWRGEPTTAELAAARRIVGELGFFQWNDAIAQKGPDGARWHFGVRAQAVWAIMADEGLIDPIDADGRPGATPYAFLCWDAWDVDDDGEMADRFGIRPDQLALFLIAAQERRIAMLEGAE